MPAENPFPVHAVLSAVADDQVLALNLNFCVRNATPRGEVWSMRSFPLLKSWGHQVPAPSVYDEHGERIGDLAAPIEDGGSPNELTVRVHITDRRLFLRLMTAYLRTSFWGTVVARVKLTNGKTGLIIDPESLVLYDVRPFNPRRAVRRHLASGQLQPEGHP